MEVTKIIVQGSKINLEISKITNEDCSTVGEG